MYNNLNPCCCRCPLYAPAAARAPAVDSNPVIANNTTDTRCPPTGQPCTTTRCTGTGEDFGPNPYAFDIEAATLANPFFRRVLWTGTHMQLTLMCIPPCGEIGLEMHANLDQFLRLEQGSGKILMGSSETSLNFSQDVRANSAILIPAGTWHNLINTGSEPIKLYSLYAPVQHPAGTIQCTKADAAD